MRLNNVVLPAFGLSTFAVALPAVAPAADAGLSAVQKRACPSLLDSIQSAIDSVKAINQKYNLDGVYTKTACQAWAGEVIPMVTGLMGVLSGFPNIGTGSGGTGSGGIVPTIPGIIPSLPGTGGTGSGGIIPTIPIDPTGGTGSGTGSGGIIPTIPGIIPSLPGPGGTGSGGSGGIIPTVPGIIPSLPGTGGTGSGGIIPTIPVDPTIPGGVPTLPGTCMLPPVASCTPKFVELISIILTQLKKFVVSGRLLGTLTLTAQNLIGICGGLLACLVNLCSLIETKVQSGLCGQIVRTCILGGLVDTVYMQCLVQIILAAGIPCLRCLGL